LKKLKMLYRNNLLFLVKWTVFAVVLLFITGHGIFLYYAIHIDFPVLIFDWFIIAMVVFLILHTTFYFIYKKNSQLEENIN